jgi:hypothetical protein
MTFGFGIGNEQNWCDQLRGLGRDVETGNLAVPGYGIDQSYMRYMRDADSVAYDVHVLAFIEDDFERMRDSLRGLYYKPWLVLEDGQLRVRGVPVPAARQHRGLELRSVALLASLFGKSLSSDSHPGEVISSERQLFDVAFRAFEELDARAKTHHAAFLLVFLPLQDELSGTRAEIGNAALRSWLAAEAARRNLAFLDVTPAIVAAAPPERLYIGEDVYRTPHLPQQLPGHFTREGSAVVAREVAARLSSLASEKVSGHFGAR